MEKLTVKELRKLAAKYRIKGRSKMNKARLLTALQPFLQAGSSLQQQRKQAEVQPEKTRDTGKNIKQNQKVTTPKPENQILSILRQEDSQELPFSYGEDRLELLPKNPEELYAFWDYSSRTWDLLSQDAGLVIRLEIPGARVLMETGIGRNVREYYFRIPDIRGPYRVTLLRVTRDGVAKVLLTSNTVKAPPNHPGPGSIRFVKIPFIVPLTQLRAMGGPEPVNNVEQVRGAFIVNDADETPYTRRFR